MNEYFNKKFYLGIFLAVILSFLMESYIIFIEHNKLFYEFSNVKFISYFSIIEFIVILVIFLIIAYILSNEDINIKVFNFIYSYRLPLTVIVLIFAVIFQFHGSSINELNIFKVSHNPILGISRAIRTDEYIVNTLFAFSQYHNGFQYFSDIIRAVPTDVFIVYGQPVLDIGMIFRPFLVGYLFLNQGQGLSFFWISRLIFLLLVSFEFGMLLTNKNKILSLSYALLITFSPVVQWWFAVNGLVEILIFGQLGVLLINWYMLINNFRKRLLIGIGLMISIGTFILVFYPTWQISFVYVFIPLAIWIILKNRHEFEFDKKDILIATSCFAIFLAVIAHVYINSVDTIKLVFNTVYPGALVFNGDNSLNTLADYIPSIFFPMVPNNLIPNVCECSMQFVYLFPIPLILSGIVLFYQKTKDNLLCGLLIVFLILCIFNFVHLPEAIIKIFLRDHINHRLITAISFVGVLLLIRSISGLKELEQKKLFIAISIILSIVMVYLSTFNFSSYYLFWMPIVLVVFYSIIFSASFMASSKRNQKIFLICVICLSFLTGAMVNPIDQGTDVVFQSKFMKTVDGIVEKDPNAKWITYDTLRDILIPAGAKTINSVHTYPDFDTWHKIDPDKKYEDVYNRYAHIEFELQNVNNTTFNLMSPDLFVVKLNVNDLEKLNVSYIATDNELKNLSNDNVKFENIYQDKTGIKIFKVKYV